MSIAQQLNSTKNRIRVTLEKFKDLTIKSSNKMTRYDQQDRNDLCNKVQVFIDRMTDDVTFDAIKQMISTILAKKEQDNPQSK